MMCRIAVLSVVAAIVGCNAAPPIFDPGNPHPFTVVDEGKGDNYISTNAREYLMTGVAHAQLPDDYDTLDDEAQEQKLKNTVNSRMNSVSRAIRSHIDDILRNANNGITGEKARYFTYFKRNPFDTGSVDVYADGQVRFPFEMEMVGSPYLMSIVAPDDGFERTFTVTVTYGYGPLVGEGNSEEITVVIQGSESRDAFPKYNELFSDGVFDIAIHFGGDYNTDRLDLDTAKWVTEHLLEEGWENPAVTSFDDLRIDSPPFTQALHVNGHDVEVRVYLYHSDMVEAAEEEKLSESMKESFANRDVVIYSGHAGSGAGFILDYQPKHEIKAADFATLDLPEKYQIFVFDGCRTYRTYVDDMLKNPAKTFDNVDMMSTVNTTPFSAGYYLIWEFLYWFTLTNDDGAHFPLSWKSILRGVNRRSFKSVHYGVHGVDNNPKLNPHGGTESLCSPCREDSECGAGGNLCLGYPTGASCGVACTTDTACPDGYRCARLTDDPKMFYLPKQCVKRTYTCQ